MSRLRLVFVILFIAVLLYSCAKIGSPDGGPRDVLPPEYVSSSPENYSILFDKEEIKIQFNEFVKLKNPQQQIIFSPPIIPKPEISPMSLASKEIKIKLLLDSLKQNTTYTINFGQSIEDNNEGNPLAFFKYVFSTGNYIDSLKLKGQINDMFHRDAPEFTSIMLFEKDSTYSDSVVFYKTPTYIAYAQDSTHAFSIENMKAGTYKLIALEDKNSDYKFNPGREKIGFVDGFVKLPTDQTYMLNLFNTNKDFKPTRPKQVSKNRLIFGYNGVLDSTDYAIKLLTKAPDTLKTLITKRQQADTLDFWLKPYFENDSLLFAFRHHNQTDTLVVKTKDLPADSLLLETKPKSTIEFKEKFYIKANLPLVKFDNEQVKLIDADSTEIDFISKLNTYRNQVEIAFEKEEATQYKMTILPEAIKDFFGNTNDTISVSLKTKSRADYSLLDLTINNLNRYPAIVQLVDDKENIEKSIILQNTNQHTFEYVKPGDYYIKIIYDDNANGVWDSGDYLKHIQPEEVIHLKLNNTLKANWDVIEKLSLP